MHYTINEVVNYAHDGESLRWSNVKIYDCNDEELEEIRAVVIRLYDAYVKREVLSENEWKKQRGQLNDGK